MIFAGKFGSPWHSILNILIGEGKLSSQEGKSWFIKRLFSNNLPILKVIVQHKKVNDQVNEILVLIRYSDQWIFRRVNNLTVL